MNDPVWLPLPGSPGCFICDNNGSNPRALRLRLMWDEAGRTVRIPLHPDRTWCGFDDVVHGGLIASVLDEGMAWAVRQTSGQWAFTADFHLRYKQPVAPNRDYLVSAHVKEPGSRKITAEATLSDPDGQIIALAEAVFLPSRGQARPRE